MLFDEIEEDEEGQDFQRTFKELNETFAISPFNAAHLDKVSPERQLYNRIVAHSIRETVEDGDANALELMEKSVYDLFLTLDTGRYMLMYQAFLTLSYYTTAIQVLWDVLEKHLNDISQIDDMNAVDTTTPYLISALLTYDVMLPDAVVMLQETIEYFQNVSKDKEISENLLVFGGILAHYRTEIIPALHELSDIMRLEKLEHE